MEQSIAPPVKGEIQTASLAHTRNLSAASSDTAYTTDTAYTIDKKKHAHSVSFIDKAKRKSYSSVPSDLGV
ncbi:hypothetical protein C8A00DRAFT_32671 [Chaetomidium leptoderma]|uniref:Uncharacterized protein n=1 Tax=Chaetomidium leptoderma TaxID=669021 RepID=A0AAN6VMX1_9PEZI|nr:hypothetical protein C8A00DRAFT_32671 [Chaetomidium leptoderma]